MLYKKDLIIPKSLIEDFKAIRNLLAGMVTGMTIDHSLLEEITKLLLCKVYDEKNTHTNKPLTFQVLENELDNQLKKRIDKLFKKFSSHHAFNNFFIKPNEIGIDSSVMKEIMQRLQKYDFSTSKRDVLGEAFEVFLGPGLRGNEGQFFTPKNVVSMTIKMLEPKPNEIFLDPACGAGGFLTQAVDFAYGKNLHQIYGMDKDRFLAILASFRVSFLTGSLKQTVFCENSLKDFKTWDKNISELIGENSVDIIATNPPFGSKIVVKGDFLQKYELAHIWKKKGERWAITPNLVTERPPQILFIERCIQLLKPGGRLGIVLPDSILGNLNDGYVREYIKSVTDIFAIVDCPLETFLPHTSTKTSVLFLRKKSEKQNEIEKIFMAIAEKCGHDRRGKPLLKDDGSPDDDFIDVVKEFISWKKKNGLSF